MIKICNDRSFFEPSDDGGIQEIQSITAACLVSVGTSDSLDDDQLCNCLCLFVCKHFNNKTK